MSKIIVQRKHFDNIPSADKSVFLVSKQVYQKIPSETTFNTNRLNYDINFDVNFDKNGGTSVSEQSRTYTVGKKYNSFPIAIHSDARFLGWCDSATCVHQVLSTDLADYNIQTLYAKYIPYIGITFDCDGGKFSDGTSSKTLKYAPGYPFSDYNWPSNPTKTGINFTGWYTSKGGTGTKITQDSICPSYATSYYADWKSQSYSVNLNSQWRNLTTWTNKDSRFVVYESYSNYNVNNGYAKMYINLTGYTEFTIYINSYAESSYDYTIAFNQNVDVTSLPSYTASGVKSHTRGYQYNPSSYKIDSGTGWKKVTYTLDGGTNTIMICYRKDGSAKSGWDRGYVAIPV